MTMTLEMAMHERHMVRRYTDKPLPDTIVKRLEARTIENNEKYQLAIALRTDDNQAFNALVRLVLAKGVKNYFLLAGPDTLDLDEKCGLAGADLMLYAQTLGLNTWWVGGTFNRSKLNRSAGANKVIGVIAVGYGADSGKPHASKKTGRSSRIQGRDARMVQQWCGSCVTCTDSVKQTGVQNLWRRGSRVYHLQQWRFQRRRSWPGQIPLYAGGRKRELPLER